MPRGPPSSGSGSDPATTKAFRRAAPKGADVAVRVQGLTKRYDGKLAVRGLSFSVPKGIIFSMVGPNGAGKTTTIEIIESIRSATTGEVEVLGVDALRHPHRIRPRIGVLPQEFYAFDRLTVRETLEYFRALYDHPKDLEEVLRLLDLDEHEDTYFADLSGGLKRRVGIGAAIVNDPDIIFLDEPTSGVDPLGRRAIWGIVRAIRASGKTVFLTTHYMDEAEALSDLVAVIDHGRLVAYGHPDELIARHGGDRSLVLRGANGASITKARRIARGATLNSEGNLVVPAPKKSDLAAFLGRLKRAGVPTGSVLLKEPSLDDVFIALATRSRKGRRPR